MNAGFVNAGLIIFMTVGTIFLPIAILAFLVSHNKKIIKERTERLTSGTDELPAAEFLELTQLAGVQDFTGCYILHNVSKDKYYVGQSKGVYKRARDHFNGRGNPQVFLDYNNGDAFTVKAVTLAQSGYNSINDLERDLIQGYDAYTKGYNGTRGNRN